MEQARFSEERIKGQEIQVGDVLLFRMSRREPKRWLKVIGVSMPSNLGTVGVCFEQGCYRSYTASETATRRTEV